MLVKLPALLVLAAWPGQLAAQAGRPEYRATWTDVAVVSLGTAAGLVPEVLALPRGPAPCAPCDPARLPRLDRGTLGANSAAARTASDVVLLGVVGVAAAAALHDRAGDEARGNAAVIAHSLVWTGAATQWLKVLVRRERPVLYGPDAARAAADPDSRRSFPSGHASMAFAAATAYLVIAQRERLPGRDWTAPVLYAGATGVALLRVRGGRHFPTDVAAGAVLGAAVGSLVSTIHP